MQEIADKLTRYPDGFHIHPKIKKLLEQRASMGRGEHAFDYGMAEAVAFGSLLLEGTPVRLSGQDSQRGTFNQRHSVLIDIENEQRWVPLNHLGSEAGALQRLQLDACRRRACSVLSTATAAITPRG